MNIIILGAGAMGSLFGGLLSESHPQWQVTLADVWRDHVEAINEKGLELNDEDGLRSIKVTAGFPSALKQAAEAILVFTKAQHTESALEEAKAAIGPETRLISLQNGLGAKERLNKFAPLNRIIIGMTTYTSDFLAPGRISSHGGGVSRLMAASGDPEDLFLTAIARALSEAGLNGIVDPEVEKQIWKKVGFNSAFNSLCAITRLDCGQLGSTMAGRELLFGVAHECAAVGRARGVELSGKEIVDLLQESLSRHARHQPSMLQDILAGRPTEIEALNGAIIRLGREERIPTPINDMAYKLILTISGAVKT